MMTTEMIVLMTMVTTTRMIMVTSVNQVTIVSIVAVTLILNKMIVSKTIDLIIKISKEALNASFLIGPTKTH